MATIEKSSMATLSRMRPYGGQLHYNVPSHGTPQLRPDTCIYIIIFFLLFKEFKSILNVNLIRLFITTASYRCGHLQNISVQQRAR